MGLYDTYGDTQLKVGDYNMNQYRLGDGVPIDDGVYVGWDGIVVIKGGVFVAEFDKITTTHEEETSASDLLNLIKGIKE